MGSFLIVQSREFSLCQKPIFSMCFGIDTLKLKKLAFSGIEDEENLNDETLFNESATTLKSLEIEQVSICKLAKILSGLNLTKLKVSVPNDCELAKNEVRKLTSEMTKLQKLIIHSYHTSE